MSLEPQQSREPVLITDFDGTMTRHECYRLLLDRLGDPRLTDCWTAYCDGRMTHFEALRIIFAAARMSEEAMLALLRDMQLPPGFAGAVDALQSAGWRIVVASAGCEWYIEHLLRNAGVEVTVHANPGTFDPTAGLVMAPPTHSPFYDPATGISKTAVARAAVARHEVVAFAGDGRPDLEAALLVPASRRFARGWLAGELERRGERFSPFEEWSAIASALLSAPVASSGDHQGGPR